LVTPQLSAGPLAGTKMIMKYIIAQIFLSMIFLTQPLIAQEDSTSIFGYYELRTSTIMQFEFRTDSTFTYKQFFDVGGWIDPVNGRFKMVADTIQLIIPDSILKVEGNELLGEWKLLFDGNRIYHYQEKNGTFNRECPLLREKKE
jgi:hypothetical protein